MSARCLYHERSVGRESGLGRPSGCWIRVPTPAVAWIPACAGMTEGGAGRAVGCRKGGWGGWGAGDESDLGAGLGEIPAASAGMTELFCAGMTELFCAGVAGLVSRGCGGALLRGCGGVGLARVWRSWSRVGVAELVSRGCGGLRAWEGGGGVGRDGKPCGGRGRFCAPAHTPGQLPGRSSWLVRAIMSGPSNRRGSIDSRTEPNQDCGSRCSRSASISEANER